MVFMRYTGKTDFNMSGWLPICDLGYQDISEIDMQALGTILVFI
jgi:hypothetical protein